MKLAHQIGIVCLIAFASFTAGVYYAFSLGNKTIDLNLKTQEQVRKVMEQEWQDSCHWWYSTLHAEGAPVLCYAPKFLRK